MTAAFGGVPTLTWPEPEGDVRGLGLLLPGRAYAPSAPLLFFAKQALHQTGYAVQEVWWDSRECPEEDLDGWVGEQAATALAGVPDPPPSTVVVGKSLGTRAASWAAERGYDAIWLTPLLVDDALPAAIARNRGRQLLVGGGADQFWDGAVAARLTREGCEVMEIPDADHGMSVPGDVVRSAEIHVEVARRVAAFVGGLAG